MPRYLFSSHDGRHPFGTAGELREELGRAKSRDAALVPGLRDILDDAERVAAEPRDPDASAAAPGDVFAGVRA